MNPPIWQKKKESFRNLTKQNIWKLIILKILPQELRNKICQKRNQKSVLLTVAPTGTTSFDLGVSSGIEAGL